MENELDALKAMMREVDFVKEISKKLMATPFYSKIGEEGIFAIAMRAKELGMAPIRALNGGLHYARGKVGMPAESMNAMIRERGHSIEKDLSSNNEKCRLTGKRKDTGETMTVVFTIQDAERAGLTSSDTWKKYPQSMLFARTLSILAKQLFADVIAGCYTKEELDDEFTQSKQSSIIDVPPTELIDYVAPPELLLEIEGYEKEYPELAEKLKTRAGALHWVNMPLDKLEVARDFLKGKSLADKSEKMKAEMEGE